MQKCESHARGRTELTSLQGKKITAAGLNGNYAWRLVAIPTTAVEHSVQLQFPRVTGVSAAAR